MSFTCKMIGWVCCSLAVLIEFKPLISFMTGRHKKAVIVDDNNASQPPQ